MRSATGITELPAGTLLVMSVDAAAVTVVVVDVAVKVVKVVVAVVAVAVIVSWRYSIEGR